MAAKKKTKKKAQRITRDKETGMRKLNITDTERIARFRKAGYGGAVSDAVSGHTLTSVLSHRFKPLRQGMQLIGRVLLRHGQGVSGRALAGAPRRA